MDLRLMIGTILLCLCWKLSHCGICSEAEELQPLSQRIVGYKLQNKELPICDNLIVKKWYKMGNYVISSEPKSCGTDYSWYRQDKALSKGGPTDMTVCKFEPGYGNCTDTMTIQSFYCTTTKTYVFYLPRVSGCASAYCIERIDGKADTHHLAPTDTFEPKVGAYVNNQGLYFNCEFNATNVQRKKYLFTVEWFITSGLTVNRVLKRTNPTEKDEHFDRKTQLSEKDFDWFTKTIGFTIACSIEVQEGTLGTASHPQKSKHRFCGFEVLNKTVTIDNNNKKQSIYVQMTIPFKCAGNRPECELWLEVFNLTKNSCELKNAKLAHSEGSPCFLIFKNNDVYKPKEFKVGAVIGNTKQQPNYLYSLQLRTQATNSNHRLFKNYYLDPVRVHVVSNPTLLLGKRCHSMNDPHMLTFEGRTFENQNPGVFMLYKNKDYKQQVQIKTENGCVAGHSDIFCNCGVIVAAGRDVLTVNHCGKLKSRPVVQFANCEDGVLDRRVTQRGGSYVIHFPTGTKVEIHPDPYRLGFLNIFVDPSEYDQYRSEGLCGILGNRTVPAVGKYEDFIKIWSINEDDSLFRYKNLRKLDKWPVADMLCSCITSDFNNAKYRNTTEATCSAEHQKICDYSTWDKINFKKNDTHICTLSKRKRRDADYHITRETTFLDTSQKDARTPTALMRAKRATVFDETTARNKCLEFMNTTAVNLCTTIKTLSINSYIDNCVRDAMNTNTMEWGLSHLEGFKSQCLYEIKSNQPIPADVLATVNVEKDSKNHSNTGTNISTTGSPGLQDYNLFNPGFLKSVEDVSCPNECSGNGNCISGKCECDSGFIDVDCSIDESIPPIMNGIPDNGLCDKRSRRCLRTSVFGRNIVLSKNLSCGYTPFKIFRNMKVVTEETRHTTAEGITVYEVDCNLSSPRKRRSVVVPQSSDMIAEGFNIAISNNGKVFSKTDSIIIYDSKCVVCSKKNTTFACKIQNGFCVMNGDCYSPGERSGCLMCKSGTGSTSWVSDCLDTEIPIPESKPRKLWIIGVVIGSVAILVMVITVLVCKNTKGKSIDEKVNSKAFNRVTEIQSRNSFSNE